MYYLLLFALLPFTLSEKDQYDLKSYNSALQLAESYLINDQFCHAAEVYQMLSADFDLWNDDRINGLVCALECSDVELIDHFVQLLVDRGATEAYFQRFFGERDYFKGDRWLEKLGSTTDKSQSHEVVSSFIEINFDDFREKGLTLKEVNAHNYNLLMELVEDGDFPTEESFPFPFSGVEGEINSMDFERILLRLVEEKPAEFGELLPNWYRDGFLCKRLFVYLMAWAEPEEKYRLNCNDYTQYFLRWKEQIYTCSPRDILVINQNRTRLHLEPLHDYLQKSLYTEQTDLPFVMGEKIHTTQTQVDPEFDPGFRDLIHEGKLVEIR